MGDNLNTKTDRELLLLTAQRVKQLADNQENQTERHCIPNEIRIRKLEGFRWWVIGGLGALAAVATYVIKVLL